MGGWFPLAAAASLPVPVRRLVVRALHRRLDARLTLMPQVLAGRRVLILGPSRHLAEDLAALRPDRFDLVVRMNNGLDTPVTAMGADPLRCDLLFHSLTADARPVTEAKLRRAGVRILVHRTATSGAFLQTALADMRLGPVVDVRCLPLTRYLALREALGGFSPTTGLVATCFCLDAPVAELGLAGFSFFQTGYCAGYDVVGLCDATARARIASAAHHDPVAEARLLAPALRRARDRGVRVSLGPHVQAALEAAAGLR